MKTNQVCIKANLKKIAMAIFIPAMAFAQQLDPEFETESSSAYESSIPANVGSQSLVKPVTSIALLAAGLSSVIYGIVQDNEVERAVRKKDCACAENAQTKRNIGYAVGATLLVGGVTFYIAF